MWTLDLEGVEGHLLREGLELGEWAVKAVYVPAPRRARFSHFETVQLGHSMELLLKRRVAQGIRDYTYATKEEADACIREADPASVPNTRYRDRIYVKCQPGTLGLGRVPPTRSL